MIGRERPESAPEGMWLSTNEGVRVTQTYQRLIPLVWSGEKGLYIALSYEGNLTKDNWSEPPFEKGVVFTLSAAASDVHDWILPNDEVYTLSDHTVSMKIGLIDENGREVAPMEYTSLEVKDNIIFLTRDDGTVFEVPFPE